MPIIEKPKPQVDVNANKIDNNLLQDTITNGTAGNPPEQQQQQQNNGDYSWQTKAGYDDSQGIKQSFEQNGATGQGVESALGTNYSWEQQGRDKAVSQYGSDVLTVKQNAQENASTINQNLSQYQEQADMMQYQNNQQAEKVGWTGGYVLDQNRQMDYLKASLNAQMYGAIKLQEYGYDTSLAAARLSYDLNQKAYAQEYYTQAVTNALNEAQITGTYFSAETKDMMSQLSIAKQIAEDSSQPTADRDNANKLIKSIEDWFNTNGISREGVQTLQAWQADQQNELNWQNEIWTEYNAALQSAKASIDDNPNIFLMYGQRGQLVYQDGEVKTIDMSGLTPTDLKSYAKIDTKAKEQVQSYVDYLFNDAIALATTVTKDKNGNETSQIDYQKTEYKNAVKNMLNIINEINKGEDTLLIDVPTKYKDLYPNYANQGTQDGKGNEGTEGASGTNNNGEGGFTSPFTNNNVTKWTQASSYNAGTKEIAMNNLEYLKWNDSKDILDPHYKDEINKVSFIFNEDNMPDTWLSVFQKNLHNNKKDNGFMIETLPTIAVAKQNSVYMTNVSVTIAGLKEQGNLYVQNAGGNTSGFGLGGPIEGFLKAFYENTTGKEIQPGAMIAVGDNILAWAGDDGKSANFSTHNDARWVLLSPSQNWASNDTTGLNLYKSLLSL